MADTFGSRPTSNWGSGDLPAPWAVGDGVEIPAGALALGRMHGLGPGTYSIVEAWSIDEGDAWFFRVRPHPPKRQSLGDASGRLHVISSDPSRVSPQLFHGGPVDYLVGCKLIGHSVDEPGRRKRAKLLRAGWTLQAERSTCGACGGTGFVDRVVS